MARKKKPGKFSATKAVKAKARAVLGSPPPTRRSDSDIRRANRVKHKKPLSALGHNEDE
jgi:hypothetical protein